MSVKAHIEQYLDEHAAARRRSGATTTFLTGEISLRDRIWTALYFNLTTDFWASKAVEPGYLDGLRAGLEHCRPPSRVLDLGTGGGGSAAAAAERFPGASVVAVDISRRMLWHARRRFRRANLRFERASTHRLPYPDATFDLVLWLNAMPDPYELRRVATADAELLCASTFYAPNPEASSWVERWRQLGFERTVAATIGAGGFELFKRAPAPVPRPSMFVTPAP